MKNFSPLFILGTQRSGTTLLAKMLSSHPLIYIQNELHLPDVFKGENTKASILDNLNKQTFIDTGNQISECFEKDKENTIWGLKDPQLTNYLGLLKEFIPESKFIIMVRDPRGVVNSYIENKWGLGTNAYTGALRWKREIEMQFKFIEQYPRNVYLLRYEDLVCNFVDEVKKICTFLSVDFNQAMINYNSVNTKIRKNRENENVFKKPNIQIADKWQARLSLYEISTIEYVVGDWLEKLSYIKKGKKVTIPKWKKLYYQFHQKIIGELQIQFQWRYTFWKSKKVRAERESAYKKS